MNASPVVVQPQPLRQRVLIDCDPATGVRNRDVDDGLALIMLISAPSIIVEGVTITFGNVRADVGHHMAQNIFERIGARVPLHMGAANKGKYGHANPAVDFLIESVRQAPGQLTLLTLGPLTNIATAMLLDPEFASNLGGLVVMGGSLHFKPFAWIGEMNFRWDPKSAAAVLAAAIPKTLITMDVCAKAVFRQEHLDLLMATDNELSRYLASAIEPWLRLNRRVFFRARGFYPWDAVAAAYVIDPSMFGPDSSQRRAPTPSVQTAGLRAGRIRSTGQRPHSDAASAGDSPLVRLPMELDEPRFMAMLLNSLTGESQR